MAQDTTKNVRLGESDPVVGNWQDEHEQPSPKFLQSLVEDGSEQALEKLRSIAQDLDVDYDPDTSMDVLADRIISSTRVDAGDDE